MRLSATKIRLSMIAVAISVIVVTPQVKAQTALGDADSKTALVLQNEGVISINFSDNSAKGSYVWCKTGTPWRFGVEFAGRATNGYASLFDGEDISPEAAAKLMLGFQHVQHKTAASLPDERSALVREYWISLQAGYSRGEYRLIDQDARLGARPTDEKQDRWMVTLYGNALLAGNSLAGLSLGYSRENNYTQLAKVDMIETTIVAISDSTTLTTQRTITGRTGDYREFDEFSVNADLMWVPGVFANRVGVDLFVRYTSPEGAEDAFEPGLGFFVLKEGAPSRIVAGITAKRDDAEDEIKLGFVAGYNF